MGGTKNCPETPRQKMIGMMYLVLTAMLALNVSNEVLNGFTMTNDALKSTITSANERANSLYGSFEDLYAQNPQKTKPWLDKAKLVKDEADALYLKLETFKREIVKIADGKNADTVTMTVGRREDLDAAGQYAQIGTNVASPRGEMLRRQIDNFRLTLDSLNPEKANLYNGIFNTGKLKSLHSGLESDWEVAMFENMPAVAAITLLTKYQSDVRAAETEVVSYLKTKVDAGDFRVNKIEAMVKPISSPYVMQGGKYTAQIVLSAVDSTLKTTYMVNGQQLSSENGIYEVTGSRLGENPISGYIEILRNGNPEKFHFTSSFTVGAPSATVSNTDLNVVYRGIDNNFEISVPGVPSKDVSVNVEGGSATKVADGKYNVRANRDGEIKIIVTANIEGKQVKMGETPYRVKILPKPEAFLQYTAADGTPAQTQGDNKVGKRLLKTGSIVASYGQDALVQAKFTVVSFMMVTVNGSSNSTGSALSSAQLANIDRLEGGDFVQFKQIKAKGPDGIVRDLTPFSVQL